MIEGHGFLFALICTVALGAAVGGRGYRDDEVRIGLEWEDCVCVIPSLNDK
jgi:hypothetical protein